MESLAAIFQIFPWQRYFFLTRRKTGQSLLSRTRSSLQTFATFPRQVKSRAQTSFACQNSPNTSAPQGTNIVLLRWLKFVCLMKCCQVLYRKCSQKIRIPISESFRYSEIRGEAWIPKLKAVGSQIIIVLASPTGFYFTCNMRARKRRKTCNTPET